MYLQTKAHYAKGRRRSEPTRQLITSAYNALVAAESHACVETKILRILRSARGEGSWL